MNEWMNEREKKEKKQKRINAGILNSYFEKQTISLVLQKSKWVLPILLTDNHLTIFTLGNLHWGLCTEVGGVVLKDFSHTSFIS